MNILFCESVYGRIEDNWPFLRQEVVVDKGDKVLRVEEEEKGDVE